MARGHDVCVLLLSHRQEPFCTARVAGALAARGARVVRLDTDGFPAEVSLSGELGGAEADALVLAGERVVVDAVWNWRLWPAALDPRLEAGHREAGQREAAACLRGLLDLLAGARWIDTIDVSRAADNKARQLRLARACGLEFPATLITADAAAVRRFFAAQDEQVIAKLQTSLVYSMRGEAGCRRGCCGARTSGRWTGCGTVRWCFSGMCRRRGSCGSRGWTGGRSWARWTGRAAGSTGATRPATRRGRRGDCRRRCWAGWRG